MKHTVILAAAMAMVGGIALAEGKATTPENGEQCNAATMVCEVPGGEGEHGGGENGGGEGGEHAGGEHPGGEHAGGEHPGGEHGGGEHAGGENGGGGA